MTIALLCNTHICMYQHQPEHDMNLLQCCFPHNEAHSGKRVEPATLHHILQFSTAESAGHILACKSRSTQYVLVQIYPN